LTAVFVAWALSALVLLISTAVLGKGVRKSGWGFFVDARGRFSLTQMQIVLWTVVVLSLIIGVFVGRLVYAPSRAAGALNFAIPNELLLVMGISIASASVSTAIKTNKESPANATHPGPAVATRDLTGSKPILAQALKVEEGAAADQAIDITKFQNFWFTLILIAAYVSTAIAAFLEVETADKVTALPGFDATFVTLLGISHAGYLAGKLPDKPGIPGTVISFSPQNGPVGTVLTITAGGKELTEVTEVRFGNTVGIDLTHAVASVEVKVPQLQTGQRVPLTLIAPGWSATAPATFEVT
jgi:hypothetical protein